MEQESIKMRPREYIKIRGANEHNLKNIDGDIPRNELVVLTGLSGHLIGFLIIVAERFLQNAVDEFCFLFFS